MTQTEPTPYNPQPEPPHTVAYEPPVVVQAPKRPVRSSTKLVLAIVGAIVIALVFFGVGFAAGHIAGSHSQSGNSQRFNNGQGFGQNGSGQGFGQNGSGQGFGQGTQGQSGTGSNGSGTRRYGQSGTGTQQGSTGSATDAPAVPTPAASGQSS